MDNKIFFRVLIINICVFCAVFGVLVAANPGIVMADAGTTCGTKIAESQTYSGVKFTPNLTVGGDSTNNLSVSVENTTSEAKTIAFQKYSCRCQNNSLSACVDYWPGNVSSYQGPDVTQGSCNVVPDTLTLAAHQTGNIPLSLAQNQNNVCGRIQLDLVLTAVNGSNISKLISWSISNLCRSCTIAQPVSVTCSATPNPANVGQDVVFAANGSGGNGPYTYSWTGECTPNGSTCHGSFASSGTKTVNVTATSNGQSSQPMACTVVVNQPTQPQTPTVTCSASPNPSNINQDVIFTATPSGGSDPYTYTWTDACAGSGSTCKTSFATVGDKTLNVTVTSNGQTSPAAPCKVTVNQPNVNQLLSATCSATPSSIQVNQSANFVADVTGATGDVTYSWTGACTGTSSNCSATYSTAGAQAESLVVKSGGKQSDPATCQVSVVQQSSSNLFVSCYGTPTTVNSNQSATFISNVSGGSGNVSYTWSGACNGNSQSCTNTLYSQGNQYATVTASSNGQTASNSCSVYVNQNYNNCTYHSYERCVGNYLYWYDSCGNQEDSVGSCGTTTGNLAVTKTVRDLTTNTSFASSTYASPSDMLMFMITLQANGNANIQNVFIRDLFPANLIYKNQLVVACTNNSGSYNYCNNNYSGDITTGINIGTVYTGQTVTITYQAQVAPAQNFSFGTTTLNNSVSTTSSNGYIPNASASVIVTRAAVLGASTVSTGLTNNIWLDSFIIPLMITLLGLWMWRSGMFFGVEKWLDDKKKIKRGFRAQKELDRKISQIRKVEEI